MSTFTPDNNQTAYIIRSYAPGMIKINEQIYHKSVVITSDQLITDWPPQHIQELNSAHLNALVAFEPAILLIGTGAELIFPPLTLYGHLYNKGIGIEIMSTSAACRTFHVLTAENRKVVAALFLT